MKSNSPTTDSPPPPSDPRPDEPAGPSAPSGFYLGRFDGSEKEEREGPEKPGLYHEPLRDPRGGAGRVISRRKVPQGSQRPWVLATALFVCAAAWGLQTLTTRHYEPPPLLGVESFARVEAVRAVTARPPSLYVRLDTAAWAGMSEPQRRETLEQIGRIAAEAGYAGVHARTADGVAVGQWPELKGARVFTASGEKS